MDNKIAIIGCGNLGRAILQGLLDGGASPTSLIATRRKLSLLAERGVKTTTQNHEAVAQSEIIILAVKPYNIVPILKELKDHLQAGQIIISAATGVSTSIIQAELPAGITVFRAMPNTAADVKESLTCICHQQASSEEETKVVALFNQIGKTIVINENLMEAVTVLGACGIAYVLRFIRGMIQGGIEIGFDAKTATAIVSQTVKGASELIISRGQHPEHEIDKVTTPRGCTITGLNEMEHHEFSSSLIKGIVASFENF